MLFAGVLHLDAKGAARAAVPPPADADGIEAQRWRIATKYYTADVELHILPATEFCEPGVLAEAALDTAEALLFVLDATDPSCLCFLRAWEPLAAQVSAGCLMCVVNKVDAVTGCVPGDEAAGDA